MTEPNDPKPSDEASRFRALSLHATGGLGEVYIARDEQLDRKVALKRMRPRVAARLDDARRFLREAELTGRLEHPGVVPIYGLGRDADGNPYYAMRFIEGETMADAIERYHKTPVAAIDQPLELQRLLRQFLDVCHAVEFAHSRGVLHRDLKPTNVMLGAYGETLVVDWGLAKPLPMKGEADDHFDETLDADATLAAAAEEPQATRQGAIVGTLGFMSPEQARGAHDELSPASDVFSLGAILFCILAGEPPAHAASQGAMIRDAQQGFVRDVRTVRPQAPPALAAVCMKALAATPSERYPTARALSADIERWLADEPVAARREGFGERLGRWMRKHRTATATAAALTVAVTAASVIGLVAVRAEQRETERQRLEANRQRAEAETARDEEAAERKRAEAARRAAEEAGVQADHAAYAAHIQAADALWQAERVAEAKYQLEACREDLRGWEHGYLAAKFAHGHQELAKVESKFIALAKSDDDARLFTAEYHGRLCLREAASGRATRVVQVPVDQKNNEFLAAAAVASDFGRWAAARNDGLLYVGTFDDAPPKSIAAGEQVTALTFADDNARVVGGDARGTVYVWDTADAKPVHSFDHVREPVACVGAALRGASIAVGHANGLVHVYSLKSKRPTHTFDGQSRNATSVAYNAAATLLAAGFADGSIRVWNLEDGHQTDGFRGQSRPIMHVKFIAGDSRLVSSDSDGTIRLWQRGRENPLDVFTGHVGPAAIAPLGDGNSLAAAGFDGTLRLWDTAPPLFPVQWANVEGLTGVGFVDDQPRAIRGGVALNLARRVADQDGNAVSGDSVVCTAVHRDGARVVVAVDDGRLIVNDSDGNKLGELEGHAGSVVALAFGDEPGTLVSGGFDGDIIFWDVDTLKQLRTLPGHGAAMSCIATNGDLSRIATCGYDGLVKLWDVASGNRLGTLRGHQGAVLCAAFNPAGTKLATGGFDRTICVWDTTNGSQFDVLRGHAHPVTALAYLPDDRRIASTTTDGMLTIWDPLTGQPILSQRKHDGTIRWLAIDREGKQIITGGNDRRVVVWESKPGSR